MAKPFDMEMREFIKPFIYMFESCYKHCHINVYIALLVECKMLKLQKQHKFVHLSIFEKYLILFSSKSIMTISTKQIMT